MSSDDQSVESQDLSLWFKLARRLHRDQRGAVSIETMLLIGAIVLPVLIFLLRFGWPRVKDYFEFNLDILEVESEAVTDG